ncbi:MAG: HNH endonuclease [Candidatus Accumulibacter sp.]|jgi:site-specific DNA-methyltransferase (adenine-specific)|nr:HNH endonuclease [Accumulibacter sp.]
MRKFRNTLYTGDNLYVLHGLDSGLADLIYLDPPFNSKRMYSAPVGSHAAGASFKDMWTWKDVDEQFLGALAIRFPALARYIASVGGIHGKPMMAYLTYMAQRVIEMHRVLKNTGSLYFHCDPTASHYLKPLLDEIFGKNNFRNEIVWHYRRWTGKARKFQALHDIIYFYTKSDDYTFNPLFTEYTEGSKERKEQGVLHRFKRGETPVLVSDKKVDEKGVRENDVWQIPFVAPSARERTGYPTQKPLALLHRIVKASSNEGDIVLDPFCGCATTCVAAQQLGRKWIGIDIEKQSVSILVERLSDDAGLFRDFTATSQLPVRTDIKETEPTQSVKTRLYKEQNGKCNACGTGFDILNLEIDHIIPKAKGGGNHYENYQLLCGSCNRIKGDRPMEYLRMQIETREKLLKRQIVFGE